jgi:DNA polymerase-3 subunit gamma/tau
LSKDVGGALLMLDDVLQRGFEGDVILNGFAEHFRNLLLSKDVRMAQLLDVPEDHRRLYFEKAQIIPSSYILSGLSVLGDAEIGFRPALNKRLHLELCMIRLCYLNDILEASATNGSELKKKPDTPVTLPQQPQQMQSFQGQTAAQQPAVKTPESAPVAQTTPQQNFAPPVQATTPLPVEHKPTTAPVAQPQATAAVPPPSLASKRPKLGRNILQEIQQQSEQENDHAGEVLTLSQEVAEQLFTEFKDHVRSEMKQMNVAAQLEMMSIQFVSENELRVLCVTEVNMIYGQNQREAFMDFGKKKTRIPDLRIMVQYDTSARKDDTPIEKPLTKLEIYELMASQNPALKLLRDSLNLQIDF